jgi:hypothetical protein
MVSAINDIHNSTIASSLSMIRPLVKKSIKSNRLFYRKGLEGRLQSYIKFANDFLFEAIVLCGFSNREGIEAVKEVNESNNRRN